MTAEPVDAADSDGDTPASSAAGPWAGSSAAARAEARWQWLNEQDADAARRRAPVSARAQVWARALGGPKLAAVLAEVDVAGLSDDECVVYAQAVTRQQSWTDAMLFDVTARFAADRPGPDPDESFGFGPRPGVGATHPARR